MMTLKENTANSMSQPMNNAMHRSYSTIGYDYRHPNPWEKPNYATFHYQQSPLFPTMSSSTGGVSTTNKSYTHSSFDMTPNLNNTNPNFYRRHTESALPTSTSIYSSSTNNHPSTGPFNYTHHPSEVFFGWNNGSSLMRTHSASYQDYPQSTSFPCYNPISSSQSATNNKSTHRLPLSLNRPQQIQSMNTPTTNNSYPSFFNIIPPMNFSFPPPPPPPSASLSSHQKYSIPSRKKHPRLTAQLRHEILQLKANKPTIFVWEIQQTLLQNGICTAHTLPNASVIQRILNKPSKSTIVIKEEAKPNVDFVRQTILNNIQNKPTPVTTCSSPSLSINESISECSICLETYRSGQEVSILSCSHEYHSSCIKEWMIKNRSCPMCRKDIHNQPQFVTLLI